MSNTNTSPERITFFTHLLTRQDGSQSAGWVAARGTEDPQADEKSPLIATEYYPVQDYPGEDFTYKRTVHPEIEYVKFSMKTDFDASTLTDDKAKDVYHRYRNAIDAAVSSARLGERPERPTMRAHILLDSSGSSAELTLHPDGLSCGIRISNIGDLTDEDPHRIAEAIAAMMAYGQCEPCVTAPGGVSQQEVTDVGDQ
jgi:hypothetical protein